MDKQSELQCDEKLNLAIESLIYVLSSRDGKLRQAIRNSLVTIGQSAVPYLILALESNNKNVRWEAAKALDEIGDPSAASALVERLKHDYFGIRWIAAEALIKLGKDGIKPLLTELLHNPDLGFLRDGAHHVLYVISQRDLSIQDALTPLVDSLASVSGKDIIQNIHTALSILGEEDSSN